MIETILKKEGFQGNILKDSPIGEKTAFKTGGNADYFIEPLNEKSLKIFVDIMRKNKKTFFVIGAGTNILIKKTGVEYALSLKKGFNGFHIERETDSEIYLKVKAGTNLSKLCWFCAKKGYKGLNPLIGIPGLAGGSAFMNAGTDLGTFSDVIENISVIDDKGIFHKLDKKDIEPFYRGIGIKKKEIKNFIIIEILLRLEKSEAALIYKEAKALISERKKNQPLKTFNCGCFFKNPKPEMPAGMLIDKAGLKGKKVGGAMVSTKHANFITNEKDASAEDIINLKEIIQLEVRKKFSVNLEPEVKIVGR
ncbi:MAG: UDP-N-acetylenolpyruvoylglucosamine reductase [Deltaproteobacteria bacterium]|nr:MAG: UDP-N-acetylenolpyruvoylglucosamine reductase [Deltaproteobacteria bacterium]